jgi:hypothetical protein
MSTPMVTPSNSRSMSPSSSPAPTPQAPPSSARRRRQGGRLAPARRSVSGAAGPARSNIFTWISVTSRPPRFCRQIRLRSPSASIPASPTTSCARASTTSSIPLRESGPTTDRPEPTTRGWRVNTRARRRRYSRRNASMASKTAPGNSSCTESFPRGSVMLRMPGMAASASISARDRGGVSAP